ncbi:MAG: bifunctional precorrin-2 dehydrogenase/sirohydrochlorin ferrochelatase [Spirochaetes bacterium]|nr:MAG: bifunctional precorrin-2 dehydrogenase/sirohydrochlorin ferrochelatase [Spirochaetota bacterium]
MKLYPVFLNLEGKSCTVIGGGRVAERKVRALVDSGAVVKVIAPEVSEGMELLGCEKEIAFLKREYRQGDLEGAFLVIAATNCRDTNASVYKEAEERGIPVNIVDSPEHSSFYVPSVLRRGDLCIAISTSGVLPYFAKKLRVYLEEKFYPEIALDIERLAVLRREIIAEYRNYKDKQLYFSRIIDPEIEKIFRKIEVR